MKYKFETFKNSMKIENCKLKIEIASILLLFALIIPIKTAYANGVGLKISPTLIQIKAHAPSEIDNPLTIENLGNKSLKLKAELKPFKASDMNNGEVEYLSEKPNFGNNSIKLFDNDSEISELTLGPRQKKTLKLKISIPANQTDVDYYFSALFTSIPESITPDKSGSPRIDAGQNSFSMINTGIASNVLLSIRQMSSEAVQAPPTAQIEEFTAPTQIQSGPVPFKILVKNTSSHFISPTGIILIKNMFGQTVGKVDIPPANILSNSSRYLQPVWPEKFLLGFYNVELSIKLSDQGPVLSKHLKFFAFPIQALTEIGIGIILLIIIYSKVKKKL